ncbi:MAG TPA: DMT family transporter [Hyphomicrobiaceae bacterium]|nr:DMT family transporter [Hyphomicrobiaceae bacterium]
MADSPAAKVTTIDGNATPQRILLGIFFMCLASTLFPIMNGLVQILSDRYSSPQIVWARTASHLIFIMALFMPKYGIGIVSTRAPALQIGRSICLMASTLCFFHGVKYLPLAKAASISFMAPFIVALLSWPLLRERVSAPRLAAVIVGFLGVLIVVQPGGELFDWASLFILASAIFYAVYQIFTRKVAAFDIPETSAVYSALVGTLVMSIWVPFTWTTPTLVDAAVMFSLGILGGLGHYCVARAMTYAPANIVSPFQYWQMVGSVIVGYLITSKMPEQTTWLGAAVIIAAGLFIGWRETREKRSKAG